MFSMPTLEPTVIVIVEAKGKGKYARLLYSLIGTNDDDGENVVGPVDGSVQATIFDEKKLTSNPLSSIQRTVFIGDPKFAKDDLDALDALAGERLDIYGIRIRIAGKQASISVDGKTSSKEDYWAFLEYAASKGFDLPDLLADLRGDGDKCGDSRGVARILNGITRGAKGIGDMAALARSAAGIEDQKYQLAIRIFYLENLRAFAEE